MKPHWDIFCRVIDNLGDVGVCLRLARQLVSQYPLRVRLWVDDPGALKLFIPDLDLDAFHQLADGLEIRHWRETGPFDEIADVVIEAFACELPPSYLAGMAARNTPPRWINLEYLSAESWVEACHGLPSPHPRLPLVKTFFFPGFTPSTGGLLREAGLLARRDHYCREQARQRGLTISLFCYPSAPVQRLLESIASGPEPVVCLVPPGAVLDSLRHDLGGNGPWQRGSLCIQAIPFLSQDEYDQLLWRSDINFVRGEDSFLRAQWAGKPFVWQIYAQAEDAHLEKLEAFIGFHTQNLQNPAATALQNMFHAWNGIGDVHQAWPEFLAHRHALGEHTRRWAENLSKSQDLASALVSFCDSTV